MADNPFLYIKGIQFGHATVADGIDEMFQPRCEEYDKRKQPFVFIADDFL
jgi:hypothetical protein